MRVIVLGLLATLFTSPALAFEGELKAKLSGQQGMTMRVHAWYSQQGDVRIDTKGRSPEGQPLAGSTIMPAKGKSYYSVLHDRKVIIEVPYESLRASSQQVSGSSEDADLEIKKLGKEKISGVETEHVRVIDKDNDATIDLWITQKYPPDLWTQAFRGRNLGLEMSDDERMKAMKKYGVKPGFSMKMRVEQPGGPPVEFLVEEIKKTKVSQEAFALPSDYQRIQGGAPPTPVRPPAGQLPTKPTAPRP